MEMLTTTLNFYTEFQHSEEPGNLDRFKQVIRENKVTVYKGLPEGADYRAFYESLGQAAGNYVKLNEDYRNGNQNEQLDNWLDIRFEESKKKETFRHSDTRQPIHTDGAYNSFTWDVTFFYCLAYAPIGGATTFIDGVQLVDIMETYEPELLKELEEAEVVFDKGETQRKTSRIIRYDEKGPLLNWNYYRISDDNDSAVRDLCERFHWFLENKIVSAGLLNGAYLKTGEAVFFHDERVLHGRNAFFGNRHLMKGGLNL
ncbi:MAG: hypothetical protein RLY31_922 [Bacteroidota bacterium]|jgi:alpha-ketoglutarate-dependent taurine dioxygenase